MNTLTLYVDARASHGRFAICGIDRKPVWCGAFLPGEGRGQIAAELAAAKRAVLFASKTMNKPRELTLHSDAQWLAAAERKGSRTQPAAILHRFARGHEVALTVVFTRGTANPADWYTTSNDVVFPPWKVN